MARTLVTGGDGFIGSLLAGALLRRGDDVRVLDRQSSGQGMLEIHGLDGEVDLIRGEVDDTEAVVRAVTGSDSVFHLAAETLVGRAAANPSAAFRANVAGTWNVLEACREAGTGAVVVASSDKAYGPSEVLPYTEEMPLRPASPYEASKAAADVLARSYWTAWGLPVAVTRFANVYGGGDLNGSRLVPELFLAALEGRTAMIRSDGTPERDYLHVSDAVAAYLAVETAVLDGPGSGEALNAGTGKPWSVAQLVSLVGDAAGVDLEAHFIGAEESGGEIDRQFVDGTKLAGMTGFRPQVGLDEGLAEAFGWYRDRVDLLSGSKRKATSTPSPDR